MDAEADRVRLTLDGARGEIGARGLQDALSHLLVLVRDAGGVLGLPAGEWTVSRLELGSVLIELENPAAVGVPVMIDHGVQFLEAEPARPSLWTLAMLKSTRALGRLTGKFGIHQVRLAAGAEDRILGGAVAANADKALTTRHTALGTVCGRLDRWSTRSGRRDLGMLVDGGETLALTYPDDLEQAVLSMLNHHVEAWGMIERNAAGQRIRLALEGLAEEAPRGRPVSVEEVSGLYTELFPDVGLEQLMREIRGDA